MTHIDGHFVLLLDVAIRKARTGGVVDVDGSGCLWVSEFFKGSSDRHSLSFCYVSRCDLGLSSRSHLMKFRIILHKIWSAPLSGGVCLLVGRFGLDGRLERKNPAP